jgi:hypothetical protein
MPNEMTTEYKSIGVFWALGVALRPKAAGTGFSEAASPACVKHIYERRHDHSKPYHRRKSRMWPKSAIHTPLSEQCCEPGKMKNVRR